MSFATGYRPHYTVADYEQWDGDWELWQGTPVAMSPSPSVRHQQIAGQLFRALAESLQREGCSACQALYETDWRVAHDTVVRPDVVVVCGLDEDQPFISCVPRLIVEVTSPRTVQNDRIFKKQLYADQQVGCYLIADQVTGAWELMRLQSGKFEEFPARQTSEPCRFQIPLSPTCQIELTLPGTLPG
jgi:Uma2 family endonuclease